MNQIRRMIEKRNKGIYCGVPSYCTSNKLVIEAVLEQAIHFNDDVLIEATANQVNQYGGYTGMKPADFKQFVYEIAEKVGFPKDKIILGGDHLGPLLWSSLPESEAMEKSIELVKLFVKAGYKKIHLDTSMRLADDPVDKVLSNKTIARRGAILYEACEKAYQELLKDNPKEEHPVFIIGSEVPIPGGEQEKEDSVSVTKPAAAEQTIKIYKEEFEKRGLKDAFVNVVGVVVQPGVEFGDSEIFRYDHTKAAPLCEVMKKYDGIVMEGHSTDYQSPKALREMVKDGVAILKVGPALTYSLREGLFALSMIEKILISEENRSDFVELIEKAMLNNPIYWMKYYHGTKEGLFVKRKYSFSDRCRYYLAQPEIESAIEKLFINLDTVEIPLSMLHQYMPLQYLKVRDKKLEIKAKELAKDSVVSIVEAYNYATIPNYIIENEFVNLIQD